MKVLLVDDDSLTVEFLAKTLREHGYAVDTAEGGEEGLFKAEGSDYDAIVLDVIMPGVDGWQVLSRLRKSRKTPVLMLTSRNAAADKVSSLDAGADDHLAKPFDLAELLARIRALIRRATNHARSIINIGAVTIDIVARVVTRAGERVLLSPREYGIVEHLALHQGDVVTRGALYEHLFDEQDDSLSNVIDVHVAKIRKKLGRDFIVTRHGHGYSIEA